MNSPRKIVWFSEASSAGGDRLFQRVLFRAAASGSSRGALFRTQSVGPCIPAVEASLPYPEGRGNRRD